MLDKLLMEEQVPRVDERLVKVVRIIVEEYDGDVKAFVEAIRYRAEVIQRREATQANAARRRHGAFKH